MHTALLQYCNYTPHPKGQELLLILSEILCFGLTLCTCWDSLVFEQQASTSTPDDDAKQGVLQGKKTLQKEFEVGQPPECWSQRALKNHLPKYNLSNRRWESLPLWKHPLEGRLFECNLKHSCLAKRVKHAQEKDCDLTPARPTEGEAAQPEQESQELERKGEIESRGVGGQGPHSKLHTCSEASEKRRKGYETREIIQPRGGQRVTAEAGTLPRSLLGGRTPGLPLTIRITG